MHDRKIQEDWNLVAKTFGKERLRPAEQRQITASMEMKDFSFSVQVRR